MKVVVRYSKITKEKEKRKYISTAITTKERLITGILSP